MKRLVIIALLVATSAFAKGPLERETITNTPIQGFAPDGLSAALLTVVDVAYDMSLFAAFSVYSPADCKIRFKASASKAGSISETVVGGQWSTFVVNKKTPFVSISGCTSGNLRRM